MSQTNQGRRLLNFFFLLRDYVRLFAHTDPREAVSYFNLIQDQDTKLQFMKELVVEAKDVTTLLGSIESNGTRKKGCMEEFLDTKEMLKIVLAAAKEYDKMGRFETAVDLYFIAEELQRGDAADRTTKSADILLTILTILSKELSQVLTDGDNRDQVITKARLVRKKFQQENMLENRLKAQMGETYTKPYTTFLILLELTEFHDLAKLGKWDQALQVYQPHHTYSHKNR